MASIQTVRGEIKDSEMGLTLPHEHIFLDLSYYWSGEPKEMSKRAFFAQKMSLDVRSEAIYNPWAFRDNTILDDFESAKYELNAFKSFGGKTIVDVTAYACMGRDPVALLNVSGLTGVNVVMSTGRYSEPSMDENEHKMSIEDIEKRMLDEFKDGVGNTGIKPGLLKVGFQGELDKESEIKSLRAAARAQKKLGCGLNIHSNIWQPEAHKFLDIVEEEGGDVNRVVLSHMDFTGDDFEYHDSLAKRGAYVEYDTFGCECVADPLDTNVWFKSDGQKIGFVKKQIELGNVDRLLLSGDMCLKLFHTKWGGWGYSHIPKHIFPRMRGIGITAEQINAMSVENPRRVFCY